ncbi:MAG: ribonuclease E activity regulator RraA [Rubrobacteraceae bacterium]
MSTSFQTADICDEFPESVSVCEPMFTSYGAQRSFHGPIATVRVHEDNVLVRQALEDLPSGTVLVVDGGGSKRCALLGDKLASIAATRNLAGIIINGCIRDSREISEIEVGVLALATHPLKSRKKGEGERDEPVEFGGLAWTPGQYLYADEDGVILAPVKLHDGR